MNTICHLSGLPLCPGDPVIVLPIAVSTPTESRYCNVANRAADLFYFPLHAKLEDYYRLDVQDGDHFLAYVNDNLANKTAWFSGESPFASGSELFATVKNDDGGIERGEWINPTHIAGNSKPDERIERFHTDSSFTDIHSLFDALNTGSLVKIGAQKPTHCTYLIIDEKFFNKLSSRLPDKVMSADTDRMLTILLDALEEAQKEPSNVLWTIIEKAVTGVDFYEAKAIFMNSGMDERIKHVLRSAIIDLCKRNADRKHATDILRGHINNISLMSAVYTAYRVLGRTFLPQTDVANLQAQSIFANLLCEEIEALRASSRAELIEDGMTEDDDAEELDRLQWKTY